MVKHSTRDRDVRVTLIPVLVPAAGFHDAIIRDDRNMQGFAVAILKPGFAAAVAGLDGKTLRELERIFGKLDDAGIHSVIAIAKLLDAIRRGDAESLKQYVGHRVNAMVPRELEAAYAAVRPAGDNQRLRGLFQTVVGDQAGRNSNLLALVDLNGVCRRARLCAFLPVTKGKSGTGYEPPRVGLLADDLVSGLQLQLVCAMNEPVALAFCAGCGVPYVRTKVNQTHHDLRCANRDRQRKHRGMRKKEANNA